MEKMYKIVFDEKNVLDSLTYILVSKYNLKPNVLKAEIDGDNSGVMILSVSGEEKDFAPAEAGLKEMGYKISNLDSHIVRDEDRCFHCGACVSLCPVFAISVDKDTYEVNFNPDRCIACGSCLNACSVRAIKLSI